MSMAQGPRYVKAQSLSLSQAVVRLDGQYGNGAIVADLAGHTSRDAGQGLRSPRYARSPDPLDAAPRPCLRAIPKRERVEPSLTSLISLFRPSGHAHGSSSPHIQQLRPRRRSASHVARWSTSCFHSPHLVPSCILKTKRTPIPFASLATSPHLISTREI